MTDDIESHVSLAPTPLPSIIVTLFPVVQAILPGSAAVVKE
jgi:hypothetical protein